jgi:single-stranded DNA-binding protein
MSWSIGENKYPQIATFWKIAEDHDTWAVVSLSTSNKDKDKNWHNSNWNFVRFVGAEAYKNLKTLNKQDKIVIKSGRISQEQYTDKDGKLQFPKNPQITVFAWEKYVPAKKEDSVDPSEPTEEEFPF